MKRFLLVAATAALITTAVAGSEIRTWPWMHPTPQLWFYREKGDLNAVLNFDANGGCADVVVTSFCIDEKAKVVHLTFALIQNQELFAKHQQISGAVWNLRTLNRDDYSFEIHGSTIHLTTDQVQKLMPNQSVGGDGQ